MTLAVGVVWFWQDSLRVRDAANTAAMEACARMGLQFLDGTVAYSQLRVVRESGRLCLRRTYVFDYTANSIGRLQGFVMMLSGHVESVGFAPTPGGNSAQSATYPPTPTHPPAASLNASRTLTLVEPEQRETQAPEPPRAGDPGHTNSAGKVFDLAEWRKSRQRNH